MRKLHYEAKIKALETIPGADRILLATINGWKSIVRKGQFHVGETILFYEIDSLIENTHPSYAFLGKVYLNNNNLGYRIRSMKLRGVVSQGLVMPLISDGTEPKVHKYLDSSEILDMQPAKIPQMRQWPEGLPKTDQERIQNITEYFEEAKLEMFQVTLKMDGRSISIFRNSNIKLPLWTRFKSWMRGIDPYIGVCSRNLVRSGNNKLNTTNILQGLLTKFQGLNIALQGELCGPGIQKNPHNLSKLEIFIFAIFDFDKGKYWTPQETRYFCKVNDIQHVKIIFNNLFVFGIYKSIPMLEDLADKYADKLEGLVFKPTSFETEFNSFKVVRPDYLIKEDK